MSGTKPEHQSWTKLVSEAHKELQADIPDISLAETKLLKAISGMQLGKNCHEAQYVETACELVYLYFRSGSYPEAVHTLNRLASIFTNIAWDEITHYAFLEIIEGYKALGQYEAMILFTNNSVQKLDENFRSQIEQFGSDTEVFASEGKVVGERPFKLSLQEEFTERREELVSYLEAATEYKKKFVKISEQIDAVTEPIYNLVTEYYAEHKQPMPGFYSETSSESKRDPK